jgi:hypothetical protein
MTQIKIQELFQGDNKSRGVLSFFKDGHKDAYTQKVPFDWQLHLSGKLVQGLSPINTDLNKAKWLCCDIDLKIKPEIFCSNIFKNIGSNLFCFSTMSNRWRVVEFLDDWESVELVHERAKELEKKIEKIAGYKCDSGKTLPGKCEQGKAGSWIFLPYHNDNTVCYSPAGFKLTQKQFEFRAKYKHIPLIVSSVGAKQGGRNKALFSISLYKKHYPECTASLEEINKHFNEPMNDREFYNELKNCEKSAFKEEYTKEYLLKGTPKWCHEICGVTPYIDENIFEIIEPELINNYTYCRLNKDFFEHNTNTFIDREQMDQWWLAHAKGKSMSKQLLMNPSLTKVHSVFIHPGYPTGMITVKPNEIKGISPGEYLNYYKPSDVLAKPGDHSKFVEYYKWLLESDDRIVYKDKTYTQFDILMFFLANLMLNPGDKHMWGILWQSTQGTGKGILAETMECALGESNVLTNVTFDRLVSDHSTLLMGKQLIFINELMITGQRLEGKELANKLKPYFTDPVIIINPKFKQEIKTPNFCNLILLTNDDKPIYIDKDDRRICAIKVYKTKEEIVKKLEEFKPHLLRHKNDPSAIKHYLMNEIELPDNEFFKGHAPETQAKLDLIGFSKDDFDSLMDEAFENHSFPFANKHYEDAATYYYIGFLVIDNLFQALKYDPLFKSVYFDKSKIQLWIKRNCKKWANGEYTKVINLPYSRERRRAWLMEDYEFYNPKGGRDSLSTMSSGELGKKYDTSKFISVNSKFSSIGTKDDKNIEGNFERTTHCWNCKKFLSTDNDIMCSKCKTGILCKCGACRCQKPKQQNFF